MDNVGIGILDPNAVPITTPVPTATPTSAPDQTATPTPASTDEPTPTPPPNLDVDTPYWSTNEAATDGGLAMCAVTGIGFALNNNFLSKKH